MSRFVNKTHCILVGSNTAVSSVKVKSRLHDLTFTVEQINTPALSNEVGVPDIIVLDPSLNADELITTSKVFRQRGICAPIVAIASTHDSRIVSRVLEAGADYYIADSAPPDELSARLKAIVRRNKLLYPVQKLIHRGMELNLEENIIRNDVATIELTCIEAAILKCLMQAGGNVVARACFFEQVWGINDEHTSNRLDVYIRRVRHKLQKLNQPLTIHTVHSKGYRLG